MSNFTFETTGELLSPLMMVLVAARKASGYLSFNRRHFSPDQSRSPAVRDVLRQRGAVILSDDAVPGGLQAIAMMGSIVAGVVDARRSRSFSRRVQIGFLNHALNMGLTHVIAIIDIDKQDIEKVDGFLYWSSLNISAPDLVVSKSQHEDLFAHVRMHGFTS